MPKKSIERTVSGALRGGKGRLTMVKPVGKRRHNQILADRWEAGIGNNPRGRRAHMKRIGYSFGLGAPKGPHHGKRLTPTPRIGTYRIGKRTYRG